MPTVGDAMRGYNKAMKPPSIPIQCCGCKVVFYVQRKQRKRKYCTQKCCKLNRPPQIRANPERCLQCRMLFRRRHGETKRKFCSRSCFFASGIPKANGETNRGRPSPLRTGFDRRAYNRNSTRKLRVKVLEGLGGICVCCGEKTKGLLTLEHVGLWGREHRLQNGKDRLHKRNGSQILRDVIRSGYDKNKFEVRCYNCNLGAAHAGNGICPHVIAQRQMEMPDGFCG